MAQQQTQIIAHRGAWKEFALPENSIASLQKAIELKCYGSEFDVRRTKDGILVVNHDPVYFGDTIEVHNYADLNKNKLTDENNLLRDSLASYNSVIRLIQSNYHVNYNISRNGKKKNISVNADKLDSALVLLPYFRDRLKLDKEGKVWTIKTSK